MGSRSTFRRAVKWAYVMTMGQRGIALVLTFVLAAILGPKDFGLVTMAMAFIIIIDMLVAQGMGAAIIQRGELAADHLDSAFWLILLIALILACVSVALSPWWAAVNDLPELTVVIRVLSFSIPIKALAVVQRALLQRKMDFRSLALISGASSVTGGVVGVAMALTGYGVWSLVAQQLVDSLTATACVWAVNRWRPRLRFSIRHIRDLFGFSSGVFVSQLGVYVAAQADVILMGIFFGPVAVGLYRLANRVMTMLLEVAARSIQIVALPHFSRLQDDPVRLRDAVLSCVRLSATITIPAMAILAVVADELMAVLGEKWAPSAPVLMILVVMGATKAITLFTGPLLLSKGRSKTVAALVWLLAIATAAATAGLGVLLSDASTKDQIITVAAVRTGLFIALHGAVSIMITWRICRLPARRFITALAPGIVAAFAALAVHTVLHPAAMALNSTPLISLLLSIIPAACAVGTSLLLFDRSLRQYSLTVLHRVFSLRFAASGRTLPAPHD